MATEIFVKRAYEAPAPSDGFRILVDRLWPRGLSHEQLPYGLWIKTLAPSTELREWFHSDPAGRWPEFEKRYAAELESSPDFPAFVAEVKKHPVVTLLFGSHDTAHNNAVVLAALLRSRLS